MVIFSSLRQFFFLLWKHQTLLVTPLGPPNRWFWHPMTSQGVLGCNNWIHLIRIHRFYPPWNKQLAFQSLNIGGEQRETISRFLVRAFKGLSLRAKVFFSGRVSPPLVVKKNIKMSDEQWKRAPWLFKVYMAWHILGDRLIPLAPLSWSWDFTCGPH